METMYYISVDNVIQLERNQFHVILDLWKTVETRFSQGLLKLSKKRENGKIVPMKYKRYTKHNILKEHGITNFDYALPQKWVDDFIKLTALDPRPMFVWHYSKEQSIFGEPYPLHTEAEFWLALYKETKEKE